MLYRTAWSYGSAIEEEQVNTIRALFTETVFPLMFEWLYMIGFNTIIDIVYSIDEMIQKKRPAGRST
jgi:hypothetical protein